MPLHSCRTPCRPEITPKDLLLLDPQQSVHPFYSAKHAELNSGSYCFPISAIDPLVFSFAVIALMGMAILASFLPARRATRIDPMQALRNE
jgi:ABC-type lipoprotein release transport system permease subunit